MDREAGKSTLIFQMHRREPEVGRGVGMEAPPRRAEDRPGSGESAQSGSDSLRGALAAGARGGGSGTLLSPFSSPCATPLSFLFFRLFPHYACFLFLSSLVLVELLPFPLSSLLLFFLPFILFFYCFSIASIIDSFFKVNFIGVYRSVHTGHQAKH